MRYLLTLIIMLLAVIVTANTQSSVDCNQTRNRLIEVEGCGWEVYEEDICVHWEQDGLGNWYIFMITGEPQSQWNLVSNCIRTLPNDSNYDIDYLLKQETLLINDHNLIKFFKNKDSLTYEVSCSNGEAFDEPIPGDPENLRSCFYRTCTHTNSETGAISVWSSKICSPVPDLTSTNTKSTGPYKSSN